MGSERPPSRRFLGWTLAVGSIGLGCVAALVGALDTQRTCVLVLDEACDGPHWGDALTAFGFAAVLLAVGVALIVRLRRSTGAPADEDDG